MSKIGQYLRPEDEPWHELSVEHSGTFLVQAPTVDAAWLKLSYFCEESPLLDFNPELQLPFSFFHTATTLAPDAAHARNIAGVLVAQESRVIFQDVYEHHPMPVVRWPEHTDFIRQQAERSQKNAQGTGMIALSVVKGSPDNPYQNVA